MFISLNAELETQKAALDALRVELEAKGVTVKDGSWGYRLLVVDDPDGNHKKFRAHVSQPTASSSDSTMSIRMDGRTTDCTPARLASRNR